MREAFSALLTQVRKVWLNRKFAFPVACVVALIAWTVVATLPDVYEGNATLYVDTKTLLGRVLDRVAVDTEDLDAEFVALARQRLLSRPNIERLVRETDLDLAAQNPEEMDRLLNEVASTIDVTSASTAVGQRTARPNIFVLKVRHKNPDIAKKMITSLVDIFGESVVGKNRESSDQTEQFLKDQIAQYQRKLDETEARLTEFRRMNPGITPGQNNNVYGEMMSTRSLLDDARRELARATSEEMVLRRQLGAISGSSGGTVSADASARYEQWTKLNAQLESLLSQYTEQHPQVIAVRKRLAELNFDPSNARVASTPGRTGGDPSALQIELFRVQSEAAALRDKERTYAARLTALQSSMSQIPEVEAQYQALTRDYDINKEQYNALVQRRESARLSRAAELTTNQVQFQVIEPPHVGAIPVEPKRGMLLTASLFAAFGIAAGVGFLMSQIKPTFGDIRELEAATGLTAYGTIGIVRNPEATRTHRIEYLAYIAVFVALLATYAGLVIWMADDFKALLN